MARGKQKMSLIQDKAQQKACYKKRKNGILKKAKQLSILCGVDTCAIVYNPYNEEPETWPQSYDEVMTLISRFENISVMAKSQKMLNQEEFVKKTIRRTEEHIKKMRNVNRQKEIKYLVSQHMKCQGDNKFYPSYFNDLLEFANGKLNQISQRLEVISKGSTSHAPQAPSSLPPPTLSPPPPSLPLAAAEQTNETIHEGDSYESVFEAEESMYTDIENEYMDAIWAQVQAYGLSDFDDKDDDFFFSLLSNDSAGPSFSKS